MSLPHIIQADRDAIEDRGLVENDRTPDLRPNSRTAPVNPVLPAPAGDRSESTTHKIGDSRMTLQPDDQHHVTARQSESSGLWMPACTCGWSAPPSLTVAEAEAAGTAHYSNVAVDDDPTPSAAAFLGALGEAAQHVKYALEDAGEDAFSVMPAETGISVGIDLANAVSHLHTAQRLIAAAAEGVAR